MSEIAPGAVFEVTHPFTLEDATLGYDENGPIRGKSWRPGVRFEMISHEDSGAFADAVGKQVLIVVGIYKPGTFPERTFYTRQWVSPRGKRFGKTRLHIMTTQAFRRLIKGYRYSYEVTERQAA